MYTVCLISINLNHQHCCQQYLYFVPTMEPGVTFGEEVWDFFKQELYL